jgi:hypothetical protein
MAEFSLPARFTPGLEIAAKIPGSNRQGCARVRLGDGHR